VIISHFGLLKQPFGKDIPTANLYLTEQHRGVLRRLEAIVQHGGHVALTGEVGVGKSTLWRAFCERLAGKCRSLYVSHDLPSRGILREMARSFGLTPYWLRADLIAQVQHAIVEQFEKVGRRTVLAVDESHLSLLLLGQPPLQDRLRLKAVEALTQRLDAQLTLEPLGRQETGDYLRHHLSLAGASGPIVSGSAEAVIFDRSQGIPRRINQIALQCLEMATERGEKVVDERIVELAVSLN
jgi:type II secretory pathway predicted ATPase ExeA